MGNTLPSDFNSFVIRSNTPLRAYVNGSYDKKQDKGGFGLILVNNDDNIYETSATRNNATHNRMYLDGLTAMLSLLLRRETAADCKITLYTNSLYLQTGIENVFNWKRNNWINTKGSETINQEIWDEITDTYFRFKIEHVYVPTSQNPILKRCHTLAVSAMAKNH